MLRFFGLSLAVLASGMALAAADARTIGSQLIINEVPIFTLRTSQGGLTAAQRAQSAAALLTRIESGQTVEVVRQDGDKGDWRLTISGRGLVTITAAEAKAQASDPQALAIAWSEAIDKALALEGIIVESASVDTPPDKPARISVVGSLARKALIACDPPTLFTITRELGQVTLRPRALGTGKVQIGAGDDAHVVAARVLPYSAKLPARLSSSVMGQPAFSGDIERAIRTSILQRLPRVPGAKVTVAEVPQFVLGTGLKRSLTIPVKVSAPNSFSVEGEVTVDLNNMGLLPSKEAVLLYSNHPENVDGVQRLYWAQLRASEPARLLVHHKNVTRMPLTILYWLVNNSDSPLEVAAAIGDAPPHLNPTLAGYVAGDRFMRSWMNRSAEVLSVPPKSAMPLYLRRIEPEQTMSGLASLHLIKGTSAYLIGEALDPLQTPLPWRTGGQFGSPYTAFLPELLSQLNLNVAGQSKHVYRPAFRTENFAYQVGGRFQFIRVGEKAIPGGANSDRVLLGNFGVQYSIEGELVNPTDKPAKVEVVFEASAGYSGALFVVDGKYVPGKILQAKGTIVLATRTLPPGGASRVNVETIPLSGAHYPATIIVRPEGEI